MQSTVSSSMTQQGSNVESLNELLCRNAVDEDFASQAETSNRMPVLSGISLAQQERRMRQRPTSLAGLQIADSNCFEVFSDALAITCNHPSLFTALKGGPTDTLSGLPELIGEKISSCKQTLELGFDFADRSWPAYEPELCPPPSVPSPTQQALVGWKMSSQKPRISAVYNRMPSIIANPDSLRALVDEARDRDAQRITAKLRIISPRRRDDRIGHTIDAIKTGCAMLRLQLGILRAYFSHANNAENFSIMR